MLARYEGGIQLSELLRFTSCAPTLFASPYLCFSSQENEVVEPVSYYLALLKKGVWSCGGSVSDTWVYLLICGSTLFNL